MKQQERLEKMLRDDLWETDDWGTPGPDDVAEYLSPMIEELLEALREVRDFRVRYRKDAGGDELLSAITTQFEVLQARTRATIAKATE